jgi:hypothetical protein
MLALAKFSNAILLAAFNFVKTGSDVKDLAKNDSVGET